MAFVRPTLQELIDRIQNDLVTRLALTGAALRRSVVDIFARVEAAATHLLHGHLEYLSKQIFPDLSDADYLVRQADLYQFARLEATYAAGNVTLTGTNAVVVPAGTVLQSSGGSQYTTDADATISGGTATAAVTALVAGEAGNVDVGVTLTFVSPIAGITSTGTVASGGLVGGADEETDDALRTRLIARLRQAPQGGSEQDYEVWSKEVTGVTRVWVSAEELGPGTVVVRFVRDDDGTDAAIIPDAGEVSDVQDYLDPRRPVTAAVTVAAPIADALNFTLHIVPDSTDIRAAVIAELRDLIARDAEPGGTILLSQLRLAIALAAGITDFTLTVPAADVTHATGHMAVLGTPTWT